MVLSQTDGKFQNPGGYFGFTYKLISTDNPGVIDTSPRLCFKVYLFFFEFAENKSVQPKSF